MGKWDLYVWRLRRLWIRMTCRHDIMTIKRCHPAVPMAVEVGAQAWVDRHDVLNYIECAACGKRMKLRRTDRIHGEA